MSVLILWVLTLASPGDLAEAVQDARGDWAQRFLEEMNPSDMRAVFLVAICIANCRLSTAESTDDVKARVLREAPRAWEEYSAFADQLQGTSVTRVLLQDGRVERDTGAFKHNANCGLMAWSEGVMAFNREYWFHLVRRPPEKDWVISEIVRRRKASEQIADVRRRLWGVPFLLQIPDFSYLPALVKKGEFLVTRAETVDHHGTQHVRVEFQRPDRVKSVPYNALRSGVVLLDPNTFWCVRSGEIHNEHINAVSTVVYENEWRVSGKYPIPERQVATYVLTYRDSGDKSQWKRITGCESQVPRRLPSDEEFTLSAFGLPEPPWLRQQRPTPWWLWAAVAGIGLLVLAVGFRALTQRLRARR